MAGAGFCPEPGPSWLEYEQPSLKDPVSLLTIFLITLLALHRILLCLNYPVSSINEILWDAFVYVIPSRLIFALKPDANCVSRVDEHPSQHASKSEVLRNLFKLGGNENREPLTMIDGAKRPAGLGNWDNSCYQNSILQALASLKPLSSFLTMYETISAPQSTTQTLLKLIHDLNDSRNGGQRLWTPVTLKSMSSWQQQDAQEYFSKILELVEKDTATALKDEELRRQSLSLLVQDDRLKTRTGSHSRLIRYEALYSILGKGKSRLLSYTNPLEGLLAQRVGCIRCGYVEGISAIPFNCMTLPLGTDYQCDLRDRLDAFTALDTIEGVECARCTLLKAQSQLQQLSSRIVTDTTKAVNLEQIHGCNKYKLSVTSRIDAITNALEEEDFSENTLLNKCNLQPRLRVNSIKSRQAVILRAPKCLVLHLNRSLFDENSGFQTKNYAEVKYAAKLDLSPWCLGDRPTKAEKTNNCEESWELNPAISMLGKQGCIEQSSPAQYQLQAVITHYGRHENGHYVCYRKLRASFDPSLAEKELLRENDCGGCVSKEASWWRISDDNVAYATESEALSQEGAFMLFYERIDPECQHDIDSAKRIPASPPTQQYDMPSLRDMKLKGPIGRALSPCRDGLRSLTENPNEISPSVEAIARGQATPKSTAATTSPRPNRLSTTSISSCSEGLRINGTFEQTKLRTTELDNVSTDKALAFKAFRMIATT